MASEATSKAAAKRQASNEASNEVPEAVFVEPKYTAASESSDGEIQQLLAQRQTAHMNDDADSANAVTQALGERGVK